jgi:hypothetical protein
VTSAKRPEPPRPPSPPPPPEPPKFSAEALPPPSAPKHIDATFPQHVNVANLPPVTLQLLRQSIMFDSESDSTLYISRTLNVLPSEATEIRQMILAAFPDLKPGSQQIRPNRR